MPADNPVPPLAEFLRWINEMPAAFSEVPDGFPDGKVSVRAVVCDLFETLCKKRPDEEFLRAFAPADKGRLERNRLRWVLAACHVWWHPFIRGCTPNPAGVRKHFIQDLPGLAIVPVENLISEQDRREELVRRVLTAAELCFPDESPVEFKDRLAQVDSIEIRRVIAEAAGKEKQARADRARREKEVRDEMARKAAEEAAAKTSRE